MHKYIFSLFLCSLTLCFSVACQPSEGSNGSDEALHDATADLVERVQQCSCLYTTEYQVHKIVACRADREVSAMGFNLDLGIFGERKIIIPMDATLKGYIDFSTFSEANVEREGGRVVITLPDPQVMLTATKVDQEGVQQFVSGFRDRFSAEEQSAFEAEGRQTIIDEIPRLGIEQSAREGAVRLLVPLLQQMGFSEADITINFRSDYQPADLIRQLD